MSFKKFGKRFAVVMALMLVVSLAFGACGKKTYSTPVEYVCHVENEAIMTSVEKLSAVYDNVVTNSIKEGVGGKTSIDIELSEGLLSMLQLAAGVDLSWLSNISIDGNSFVNSDTMALNLMLGLGGSDLIGLDFLMDSAEGMIYLTIPDILSKYLSIDLDMMMEESGVDLASMKGISFDGLPSGKVIEKLAAKYLNIILDGVKVAEKTAGKLNANGVEENCSVVKITITEKNAMDIAKSVLEAAKNDDDLKNVIVKFGDWVTEDSSKDYGEAMSGGEVIYDEFIAAVDELLNEAATETYADDATDSDNIIVITDYVNGDDEIIGRTIADGNGDEMFSYGYAENGKNFGFELSVEGVDYILGNGTVAGKMNGEFSLVEDGVSYLTVEVKDLDLVKLDKGLVNGTFDLKIDELPIDDDSNMLASVLAIYNIRLTVEQSSKNDGKISIGLVNGDEYFIKVSVESSVEKMAEPAMPSAENTIVFSEDIDAAELLGSINFNTLLERIENLPIPEEYISLIGEYIAKLATLG